MVSKALIKTLTLRQISLLTLYLCLTTFSMRQSHVIKVLSVSFLWLCACTPNSTNLPQIPQKPMQIVSLDFCADQFVLKMIERERILALSPDAEKSFSYMRDRAKNIQSVRPTAEDVLVLKPDLIVRSYGGGPNAAAFFERAGVPILNVGWAGDIEGIKTVTLDMAEKLGEAEKGAAIAADIDARLKAIKSKPNAKKNALYMTPTGVTSGEGSLIHEMILAAGLDNFQKQSGWRPLPLERLVSEQPDLVAAAFFESTENNKDFWSAMGHPIAKKQLQDRPNVELQGAWTSCSGWFLMDAIEALANYEEAKDDL